MYSFPKAEFNQSYVVFSKVNLINHKVTFYQWLSLKKVFSCETPFIWENATPV